MKHSISVRGILLIPFLSFIIACSNENANNNGEAPSKNTGQTEAANGGQSSVVDDISQKNVVQIASGSADHSTLVTAIKSAELVNALSNAGPFTVFAPTNEAFSKLPAGTVDELLKPENNSKLQNILEYHVSVGVYNADKLQDGQSIGQVNGNNISIVYKNGKPTVNDANIITSIQASNGVIHVIDKVLLPPE